MSVDNPAVFRPSFSTYLGYLQRIALSALLGVTFLILRNANHLVIARGAAPSFL